MKKKIRIGILGTADIAFRRFLPALIKDETLEYIGIASRTESRTIPFLESYGGRAFSSYEELVHSPDVDAVYVPLPPALHFKWAMSLLLQGKHIFLEKPFTISVEDTQLLLEEAKRRNLAVHENYMYRYHNQFTKVCSMAEDGIIGELRQIRITFGFPKRKDDDFRYNKVLGGGALFDCGGYTVNLATALLGQTARVTDMSLVKPQGYEVDLYGSATLTNDEGLTAQISFGMDNSYICELEIWGSKGKLSAPRIFTAPPDFQPALVIQNTDGIDKQILPSDDQFFNSIIKFRDCITDSSQRLQAYVDIERQSRLVNTILTKGE